MARVTGVRAISVGPIVPHLAYAGIRRAREYAERDAYPGKRWPLDLKTLAALVVRAVALALAAGAALLIGACGEAQDGGPQVRDPEVSGARLAAFARPTPDAAAGQPAPEVRGTSFDGTAVSITNDGRTKALVFLAHW